MKKKNTLRFVTIVLLRCFVLDFGKVLASTKKIWTQQICHGMT